MSRKTLEAVIQWLQAISDASPLEITFHGGEPLVPGAAFYRAALPLLRNELAPLKVRFALQSNLWLLTDELCDILGEFKVSLGTSLDGPEPINAAQRGSGCFQKTMVGIERARSRGLTVGCICTFTARSAGQADDVFDFFASESLSFGVHAALPRLGHRANGYSLTPKDYSQVLVDLLDRYLNDGTRIRVTTLDAMCRSISHGKGDVCTFVDCLGHYLAVDPDGYIYPCQRVAGIAEFKLGSVHDCPTLEELKKTTTWQAFSDRQKRVSEACALCSHLPYCRGGCPFSVLAFNDGRFGRDPCDPHCLAYRRAFEEIIDRALAEVFSAENLALVVSEVSEQHGLLRKGKLVQIMRGGTHSQTSDGQARQCLAAVALAISSGPEAALLHLDIAGLVTNRSQALGSLKALRGWLDNQALHSNQQCRTCALRYLCVGHRGVWTASKDPNAPLSECAVLCRRAEQLLGTALEVLQVSRTRWQAAGLPWLSDWANQPGLKD